MNISRVARSAVAGGMVVALLSACGGTTSPSSASTGKANSGKAVVGKPYNGGSLVIGSTEEPDTLNPLTTQLVTSNSILSGVMEGMIDYNSADQIIYRLATSESVSKDGLTYTWHLRHGVKFQDGEPFNAQTVVADWKAIMNPKFGVYSQQGWNKITKMTTPDMYTVVMHTSKPYAPFAYYVGATYLSPPKAFQSPKYDQQTFGRAPVGTGPYTFVKWVSGQYVQLKKNPNYWGGPPHINTITYKIIPNDNTLMVQMKTRDVQMAPYLSAIRYSDAQKLPGTVVIAKPSLSWYHLDLKNVGFLEDPKVRVALAYATPTQEIVSRILKGLGQIDPTDTPPASPYFDPNVKPYPYNVKMAAQMLKADGFTKGPGGVLQKNGTPLSIEYWIPSGDQQSSEVQQVVSQSWKQIGIGVTNHQEDIKSIWGPNGYQFNKKLTAGGYSWFNSNDPDDSFYWNSTQIPKTPTSSGGDAVEYYTKYPWQSQIDTLTNEGVATVNPAKRKQIYWKIQQLLHQEEPILFLYSEKNIYAAPKHMIGFDPSAYNNLMWNVQDWQLTK